MCISVSCLYVSCTHVTSQRSTCFMNFEGIGNLVVPKYCPSKRERERESVREIRMRVQTSKIVRE